MRTRKTLDDLQARAIHRQAKARERHIGTLDHIRAELDALARQVRKELRPAIDVIGDSIHNAALKDVLAMIAARKR